MLTNLIVIIISKYIQMWNYHVVHFKLTLYKSIISQQTIVRDVEQVGKN